jgi:hypothetical protein
VKDPLAGKLGHFMPIRHLKRRVAAYIKWLEEM